MLIENECNGDISAADKQSEHSDYDTDLEIGDDDEEITIKENVRRYFYARNGHSTFCVKCKKKNNF